MLEIVQIKPQLEVRLLLKRNIREKKMILSYAVQSTLTLPPEFLIIGNIPQKGFARGDNLIDIPFPTSVDWFVTDVYFFSLQSLLFLSPL